MELTSISNLESALGRDLTSDEEAVAPYYISLVSDYISAYTGLKFDLETVSLRLKSDYYGVVELPGGPVAGVVDVKYYYDSGVAEWEWDGDNQIFGLEPKVAVDVTYAVGYLEPPGDLQRVATQVVKRMLLSPNGEPGSVFRQRVGDVEEMLTGNFGGLGRGMFNDFERLVMDQYRQTATTWRTGYTNPDIPKNNIPESDSALYE